MAKSQIFNVLSSEALHNNLLSVDQATSDMPWKKTKTNNIVMRLYQHSTLARLWFKREVTSRPQESITNWELDMFHWNRCVSWHCIPSLEWFGPTETKLCTRQGNPDTAANNSNPCMSPFQATQKVLCWDSIMDDWQALCIVSKLTLLRLPAKILQFTCKKFNLFFPQGN